MFTAAANDDDKHKPRVNPDNKPQFWTAEEAKLAHRERLIRKFDTVQQNKRRPFIGTRVIKRIFR